MACPAASESRSSSTRHGGSAAAMKPRPIISSSASVYTHPFSSVARYEGNTAVPPQAVVVAVVDATPRPEGPLGVFDSERCIDAHLADGARHLSGVDNHRLLSRSDVVHGCTDRIGDSGAGLRGSDRRGRQHPRWSRPKTRRPSPRAWSTDRSRAEQPAAGAYRDLPARMAHRAAEHLAATRGRWGRRSRSAPKRRAMLASVTISKRCSSKRSRTSIKCSSSSSSR